MHNLDICKNKKVKSDQLWRNILDMLKNIGYDCMHNAYIHI